jgi:hypothetical protein
MLSCRTLSMCSSRSQMCKSPKQYCEAHVAALQLLLEMQQGAVISPEELQQLPCLNFR